MVVRNHGGETHATADDEVAHYCLKARLSALEITASYVGSFLRCKLHHRRVESVLRGPIQIGDSFFNCSHTVKNGGRQGSVVADAFFEIIDSIDFRKQEHFGVCCPQHNDFVVASFAVADVLTKFLDQFLVGAFNNVVRAVCLVCCNVIRV